MIGIVIATHGKLSNGVIDAAELIIGGTDDIQAINLVHGDDVTKLQEKLTVSINKVNDDDGVIIFTDLAGASPYNQATLAVRSLSESIQKKVFVITGVNLPMLLEAINQQMIDASVEEAVDAIVNTAKQSVLVWSQSDEADDSEEEEEF
ncbi:MAG: PTS sugar transporter subunit IIA [Alkalibacterium sp.]|uniref:PTS sugar transporter subunit IIA n=1 Tax=Alkalibacterium sp. TaxID=1872447 RepID=UPI003970A3B4